MKISLLFSLFLTLPLCAFGQNRETKFTEPKGQFTLSFPSTWKVGKATLQDMRFEASRGAGKNFEYVSIVMRLAPGAEKAPPSLLVKAYLEGKPEVIQQLV